MCALSLLGLACALAFLQVPTAQGDWVSKKDLEDDATTSFDDLLASMKAEEEHGQGQGRGKSEDRDSL